MQKKGFTVNIEKCANRIEKSLRFQLNELDHIGRSKHADKQAERAAYLHEHGNLRGWNPARLPWIYSKGTMATYKRQMKPFAVFCAEAGARRVGVITQEMGEAYLRKLHAEGKSAWSISTAASAINKAMGWSLSPKALDLPSRGKMDIRRCRDKEAYTDMEYAKYRDQITIARAVGARRESIYNEDDPEKMIRANRCVRNDEGDVVGIWLLEKGGKVRCAPVLNRYRGEVTEIVDRISTVRGDDAPLFDSYGGHVRNHRLRAEYAAALLHQLESERLAGKPLFGGEFPLRDYFRLRGKDRKRGKKSGGHDTDLLGAVSGALGHNRIEVIIRHYLYLC